MFIGFQWALISIQFIIGAVIPDVPGSVVIQSQRQDFIISKLILNVEDEDYGEEAEDPNNRQSVIDSNNPLLANKVKEDDKVYPVVETRPFPFKKPADGWPAVLKRSNV